MDIDDSTSNDFNLTGVHPIEIEYDYNMINCMDYGGMDLWNTLVKLILKLDKPFKSLLYLM